MRSQPTKKSGGEVGAESATREIGPRRQPATSDPGSRTTQSIYMRLQSTAGNAAVTQLIQRSAGSPTPVAQRSQAGKKGHGTQEETGLSQAGFGGDMSSGEIGAVYFGNWLRDLSQLVFFPQMKEVINLVALGEFGHEMDPSMLGSYLPSEHLDNPLGGGSPEDPLLQQSSPNPKEDAKRRKKLAEETGKLSKSQQQWLADEESIKGRIQSNANKSGLPTYIEAGKEHARRELMLAMDMTTPRERRSIALGSALHAVEDYFAHSNFIEVALSELVERGSISAYSPMVAKMDPHGINAAKAGGADPRGRGAAIVTGTYAGMATELVSGVIAARTEVTSGALSGAFARGFRLKYPTAAAVVSPATDSAGLAGDALSWVQQRFEGLQRAASEWEIHMAGKVAGYTAPVDPQTGRKTMSHAQLAKDDDDHPLWAVHMQLAAEADRGIGAAMRQYWAQGGNQGELLGLVDFYVSHPAAQDWWEPILKRQPGVMPAGWRPEPEFNPADEHMDGGVPGGIPGGTPDAGAPAGAPDGGVPVGAPEGGVR